MEKCLGCNKKFDPDQYYFWCNKCGEKREKKWIKNIKELRKQNGTR